MIRSRDLAILLLLVSGCPSLVDASPSSELVGAWKLRRGIGGPCAALIKELRYVFGRDGAYTAETTLYAGGRTVSRKVVGTYVATDRDVTARAEGTTIGPTPYTITDDVLRVSQPEAGCAVELDRDEQ